MPEMDYTFYDTAVFTNVANTVHTLFQVANGADSTHNDAFTNMSGSGAFPQSEDFTLQWLGVTADFNGVVADYQNMWIGSIIQIEVANKLWLKMPLTMCSHRNAWSGLYTQAAAAAESLIGLKGEGYTLRKPIQFPKGVGFRVIIIQPTALSVATSNVKVLMSGIRNMSA